MKKKINNQYRYDDPITDNNALGLSKLKEILYSLGIGLIICIFLFLFISINNMEEQNTKLMAMHDSTTTVLMEKIELLNAGISKDVKRKFLIDGVEKYIASVNRSLDYSKRISYATIIVNQSEIYQNLDVSLITSVIKQESHFLYDAKSEADAVGMMGIMEETGRWGAKELGVYFTDKILKNPEMNIKIGCWFLSYLKTKYNDSETLALAHYNGGNLQRSRYINNRKLKNKKDFKTFSTETIETKISDLKDSLENKHGYTKKMLKANKDYAYLMKLLSGKKFASETKDYIPSVLNRRTDIELFITENSGLANNSDSSSTDS